MAGKRPLRPTDVPRLSEMSTRELAELVYFGDIATGPYTVTFRATSQQRREAWALLRAREGDAIPGRHPPDPRPVLSGLDEDRLEVERQTAEWQAERAAFLQRVRGGLEQ